MIGSLGRRRAIASGRTAPLVLFLSVMALAAFVAMTAEASADFRIGIDEPKMSESNYLQGDWDPLIRRTGSTIVRRFIYWSQVAQTRPANPTNPNDPAYLSNLQPGGNWSSTDNVVRTAGRVGAEVVLSVFAAPTWAEGPGRPSTGYGPLANQPPYSGTWKPNPADLGDFARALAKRYDGTTPDPLSPMVSLPRIRFFEVWNEPNYKMFLAPQCSKGKIGTGSICTGGGKNIAIEQYRQMLNAFYEGIKSVQSDATVIAAGLGPYGNSSQGHEIDPQVFARGLLCLDGTPIKPTPRSSAKCPDRAKLDALSFHPYTFTGTPTTKAASVDGGALGNAPDLRKALDVASAAGTVLPSGTKQLWETETGWMTCPPCRATTSAGASLGISAGLAARYTAEMIYRAWSWGVQKLVWFGLIDSDSDRWRWPAGLYYECARGASASFPNCPSATLDDAVAKPSLSAFRFPLFSAKTSSTTAFAWVMSPCKVPGARIGFEVLNSRTKAWTTLQVPGPIIDPKTRKPTPLVLTLPADTDGTIKSPRWAIPALTSSIRATVSGAACSPETSIAMPIAAR